VLVGGVWIGQGAGLIKGKLYDRQCDLAGHRTALSGRRLVLDLLGPAAAFGPEREVTTPVLLTLSPTSLR
jgi:hypothetical protein